MKKKEGGESQICLHFWFVSCFHYVWFPGKSTTRTAHTHACTHLNTKKHTPSESSSSLFSRYLLFGNSFQRTAKIALFAGMAAQSGSKTSISFRRHRSTRRTSPDARRGPPSHSERMVSVKEGYFRVWRREGRAGEVNQNALPNILFVQHSPYDHDFHRRWIGTPSSSSTLPSLSKWSPVRPITSWKTVQEELWDCAWTIHWMGVHFSLFMKQFLLSVRTYLTLKMMICKFFTQRNCGGELLIYSFTTDALTCVVAVKIMNLFFSTLTISPIDAFSILELPFKK